MKVKKYEDVPNNPVEMDGVKDVRMRLLLSKADGADTFAMRMFEIGPGGHTPYHAHDWEHEIFVLEGQGVILFEGKEHRLSPGNVFFVPGNKMHQFRCTDPKRFRFICLVPARGQA
jgi:quercetin dioxygenase-like cupin family protein